MISVHFKSKSFNITVSQVYAPTSNTEEAEVEWFYEDLQDLLKLTSKKDVLFIIGDWNAKVESQEIPGVTGKFGLEVQNEAGQSLTEFCQENALVIANTFQQHKRRLYTWTSLPGAGERHSTRDKGHEEGGSAYAKAGSSLGRPPDILEHLPPKTRVCLLYCFVLSPLTLLGAVPHHHLALSVEELTYSSN